MGLVEGCLVKICLIQQSLVPVGVVSVGLVPLSLVLVHPVQGMSGSILCVLALRNLKFMHPSYC